MAKVGVAVAMASIAVTSAVMTPTAPCGCVPNDFPRDANGMVLADLKGSNATLYASYGDTCGVHAELFADACQGEKIDSWCTEAWCWVDPCTCKHADVAKSSYFTGDYYYSYSNCGGTDTYTTAQVNEATCDVYNYTPLQECLPRMANDHDMHECTRDFAVFGMCSHALVGGNPSEYPPNYGEGCGVHAEPAQSDCSNEDGSPKDPAEQAGWCKEAFTWVNPCDCEISDMEASTYFPGLFYSYAACGASDTYTTEAVRVNYEGTGCPYPPPPPAEVENPGNYPGSSPDKAKCQCHPFPEDEVPKIACNTPFAQNGKCVNATGLGGHYPANYGTTCGVHIEPLSASCYDIPAGRSWPSPCRGDVDEGCRKTWCDSPWCWVDPCECDAADVATSAWFPHADIYFSYENCDGKDTFTTTEDVDTKFDKEEMCKGASCGELKEAYRESECCGQPNKEVEDRRLRRLLANDGKISTLPSKIRHALEQAKAAGKAGELVKEIHDITAQFK